MDIITRPHLERDQHEAGSCSIATRTTATRVGAAVGLQMIAVVHVYSHDPKTTNNLD